MDFEEVRETIEIPKGTGIDGFLRAVGDLLRLPRLQEIKIDARGRVSYARFVPKEESRESVAIDFESLMPYAIVRSGTVVEVTPPDANAAVVLGELFRVVAAERLYPVAWVAGAGTRVWDWYALSTGQPASATREDLFGLPVALDRMIEDDVLLLCAAYGRYASLVDAQKSFKIVLPRESR
jgi:hypothetical protein